MGTTLNKIAYQKLIDENIEWLEKQPNTLENKHIKEIVKHSVSYYYDLKGKSPKMLLEENEALKAEIGWKFTSQEKPLCYLTGNWDGKNSNNVIAEDKNGKQYLAHFCEGFMDGSHFEDWYSNQDWLINEEIVKWMKIPY